MIDTPKDLDKERNPQKSLEETVPYWERSFPVCPLLVLPPPWCFTFDQAAGYHLVGIFPNRCAPQLLSNLEHLLWKPQDDNSGSILEAEPHANL